MVASGTFMVWRTVWMAVALLATARFAGALSGLDQTAVMLAAGLTATVYAALGGARTIIRTDALQGGVIVLAIGAALVFWLAGARGSSIPADAFRPVSPWDPGFFGFDPHRHMTFWSAVIGTAVILCTRYMADQAVVQRLLAARSVRAARHALWTNVAAVLVALCGLAALGVILAGIGDETTPPAARLALLARGLPEGCVGLLVAALLAATMSSVDSGINACLATYESDLAGRYGLPRVRSRRLAALAVGGAVTAAAVPIASIDASLFVLANRVLGGIGAPILACLLLAAALPAGLLASRWVAVGAAVGVAASAWLCATVGGLSVHLYPTIAFVVTVGTGTTGAWVAAVTRTRGRPARTGTPPLGYRSSR